AAREGEDLRHAHRLWDCRPRDRQRDGHLVPAFEVVAHGETAAVCDLLLQEVHDLPSVLSGWRLTPDVADANPSRSGIEQGDERRRVAGVEGSVGLRDQLSAHEAKDSLRSLIRAG